MAVLLDANEPEATLGTLQRIAERMAHRVTKGKISPEEAERWDALAKALAKTQDELHRVTNRMTAA